MKRSHALRRTITGLIALAGLTTVAHGQSYSIDWFTIDGGGSTSAGGNYSISGTIGQPDGGIMSGGNYTLTGGFLSIQAINAPGLPRLLITPVGDNVIISWTPGTPRFVLQGNGGLSAASWTDAPSGSTNPISVPVSGAARFYRLRKP